MNLILRLVPHMNFALFAMTGYLLIFAGTGFSADIVSTATNPEAIRLTFKKQDIDSIIKPELDIRGITENDSRMFRFYTYDITGPEQGGAWTQVETMPAATITNMGRWDVAYPVQAGEHTLILNTPVDLYPSGDLTLSRKGMSLLLLRNDIINVATITVEPLMGTPILSTLTGKTIEQLALAPVTEKPGNNNNQSLNSSGQAVKIDRIELKLNSNGYYTLDQGTPGLDAFTTTSP